MSYPAAVYISTKITPASIIFGRDLCLCCNLVFGSPSTEEKEVKEYADELRDSLIREIVRERLKITSDRMKARYDLKTNTGRI